MDTNIGITQASIVLNTININTLKNYYFTTFVSSPLNGISTINADNWKYAFAAQESNASANFPAGAANSPVYLNVYVWRPSNGTKVGTIIDGNTSSVFAECSSANTERAMYGSFTGSSVSSISNGDVIVCEIWFAITQAASTAYNDTFFFDGTTENTTLNATVSNHASFLGSWQTLTFSYVKPIIYRTITETISSSESVTALKFRMDSPDVKVKKGTITFDSTSGVHDQAFSGIGFQPVAIVFWGVLTTGSSYADGVSAFHGFSDGTNSASTAIVELDNVSTYDSASLIRNDACISFMDFTATTQVEIIRGKIKTFDSDGFTITWNVKNTTQYIIHYMALGGASITNVNVAQTTSGTVATGNRGYTGVGFKPDAVLFGVSGDYSVNTVTGAGRYYFGAANTDSQQICLGNWWVDGSSSTNGKSDGTSSWTTRCLRADWGTSGGANVIGMNCSITSMDTDGFTLNHQTASPSTTYPFIYMAIKGGIWSMGETTQRTTTGIQTITPTNSGFNQGMMLFERAIRNYEYGS